MRHLFRHLINFFSTLVELVVVMRLLLTAIITMIISLAANCKESDNASVILFERDNCPPFLMLIEEMVDRIIVT